MTTAPANAGSVATSLPQKMLDMFKGQGAYCPADPRFPIRVRPSWRYWHRQAYAAAGTTDVLRFFNQAATDFVTNMQQPNTLARDYWFKVYSIGVRVIAGMGLTGAANAANNNEVKQVTAVGALAAQEPMTILEQMLRILRSGVTTFKIGDATYLERMGLDTLPFGSGPSVTGQAALDNNTTAAAAQYYGTTFGVTNNGDPFAMNQLRFRVPLVIPPQLSFGLDVRFQSALALAGGGVIEAYLEGDLYTPKNQ